LLYTPPLEFREFLHETPPPSLGPKGVVIDTPLPPGVSKCKPYPFLPTALPWWSCGHGRVCKELQVILIPEWFRVTLASIGDAVITTDTEGYVTFLNLACSPLIKRELKDMGIDALEIPIVPTIKSEMVNNTLDNHAVLTYIPKGREKFYGMHYIDELAKRFPDINFHIVANDNDSINLKNVFFHGMLNKVEMEELYNKITLLFRFPEHDGLSMMLLEALAKGKQVIYPYEFPYVETPKSRKLQDVLDIFEQVVIKKPFNNIDGAKFVTERYKEENIINEYKKAFGIQNEKL